MEIVIREVVGYENDEINVVAVEHGDEDAQGTQVWSPRCLFHRLFLFDVV
jgi:hypothetical protein